MQLFSTTHQCERVAVMDSSARFAKYADIVLTKGAPRWLAEKLIDEARPPYQYWLCFTPCLEQFNKKSIGASVHKSDAS